MSIVCYSSFTKMSNGRAPTCLQIPNLQNGKANARRMQFTIRIVIVVGMAPMYNRHLSFSIFLISYISRYCETSNKRPRF